MGRAGRMAAYRQNHAWALVDDETHTPTRRRSRYCSAHGFCLSRVSRAAALGGCRSLLRAERLSYYQHPAALERGTQSGELLGDFLLAAPAEDHSSLRRLFDRAFDFVSDPLGAHLV